MSAICWATSFPCASRSAISLLHLSIAPRLARRVETSLRLVIHSFLDACNALVSTPVLSVVMVALMSAICFCSFTHSGILSGTTSAVAFSGKVSSVACAVLMRESKSLFSSRYASTDFCFSAASASSCAIFSPRCFPLFVMSVKLPILALSKTSFAFAIISSGNACPQCGQVVSPEYSLAFSLCHVSRNVSCSPLHLSMSRWMRAMSTCIVAQLRLFVSNCDCNVLISLAISRRCALASNAASCAFVFASNTTCCACVVNSFTRACLACSASYCLRIALFTSAIALSVSAISLSMSASWDSRAAKSSGSGIILCVWSIRG